MDAFWSLNIYIAQKGLIFLLIDGSKKLELQE